MDAKLFDRLVQSMEQHNEQRRASDQRAKLDRAVDVLNELADQPAVDHCVRVGHLMVGRAKIIEAREFIASLAWAMWSEEPK